ncbi:hypothetical protein EAE96_005102 [Botrytis aclada]|nr:hypothetical protein EAE96_005102 [Botrytis aclada]
MSLKRSQLPPADEKDDDDPFPEPWTPFTDLLGTEFIQVAVGKYSYRKIFYVHKNILFDKIPHCKELCKNNPKTIEFPNQVPRTFDVLVEWVHTDRLRGIEILGGYDQDLVQYRSWDPVCLYRLAEELLLPALMDRVMEVQRRFDDLHCVTYDLDCPGDIYAETSQTSKFRHYTAEVVAYIVRNKAEEEIRTSRLLSAMENKDFAADYLSISRRVTIEDPRKGSGCRFHMHKKDEKCLAKDHCREGKTTILSPEQIKAKRLPPAKKLKLSNSSQES